MLAKTTGSVRGNRLVLNRAPFGCGCFHGTQDDAESVTRRRTEARLDFGIVGGALAERGAREVGISVPAIVAAMKSFGNGSTVLAFHLYHRNRGVWRHSILEMQSKRSCAGFLRNTVSQRITFMSTIGMRSMSRGESGNRVPPRPGSPVLRKYRRPSRHSVKRPMRQ